ncbi:MAG: ATP-dependent helicase, partial [Actinomycetes bacterium]
GGEFGTGAAVGSEEEADFLGLPGLLGPAQVTALLQARQHEQQASKARRTAAAGGPQRGPQEPALHKAIPALRKELNGLVGAWHHRTGVPHGAIHTELRQACGGPLAAQASAAQLQERIDTIRRWAVRRK